MYPFSMINACNAHEAIARVQRTSESLFANFHAVEVSVHSLLDCPPQPPNKLLPAPHSVPMLPDDDDQSVLGSQNESDVVGKTSSQ